MPTNSGAGLNDTVNRLKGILSEQAQPTVSPESPEVAAETVETEAETQAQPSDTEPKSRRVKAKLADRDVEFEVLTDDVDLDLIPKGLMMEADYRKKTMELADQRKAFEAEQSKLNDKIKDLEDTLSLDIEDLESPEMLELKEYDAEAYLKKYEAAKKKADKLQKYRQDMADKQAKERQKRIEAEVSKWSEIVPEWLDQDAMKSDLNMIANTLKNVGYSDAEMGDMYDHRLVGLLRKATLYDQLSSKSLEEKKVKSAPKSSKPESKTAFEDERTAYQKQMEKLKKTGKMRDAQAALKQFL